MKHQKYISFDRVVFSRWTRNSYALFTVLKKVVNIVRLSFDLCESSHSKKQSAIRLFNLEKNGGISEDDYGEKAALHKMLETAILLQLLRVNNFGYLATKYMN